MRKILLSIICVLALNTAMAQSDSTVTNTELRPLEEKIMSLQDSLSKCQQAINSIYGRLKLLDDNYENCSSKINSNSKKIGDYKKILDSKVDTLSSQQKVNDLNNKLEHINKDTKSSIDSIQTNLKSKTEAIQDTQKQLSTRTFWGGVGIAILLLAIITSVIAFIKKFKTDTSSIDGIRKAQSSMEKAQEDIRKAQDRIQEEAVKLDSKLIELLSKQPVSSPVAQDGKVDHSLFLKVADEVVRIEMNLSRMDKSIKGYKQLSKGVERIKENFMANNYEIVDMLGKPYNHGMKARVTFVTDETLKPEEKIISRIIKPQVNYNQEMIQAAEIEVSQAE